jgi:transposase
MMDNDLIRRLVEIKLDNGYTVHDLSKILDVQVTTIERWLKTKHINKVYAKLVREKLRIN